MRLFIACLVLTGTIFLAACGRPAAQIPTPKEPGPGAIGFFCRMNLKEQTLGSSGVGPLEWIFDRQGLPVAGGTSIVNATSWNAAEDYTVTAAPSMRMVVSLADLDDSRWINLTGVSGHPFDRHYDDQTDLWVDGRTLPWSFSSDAVHDAGEDVLTLRPTSAD
mgnify:CR=1 FL=1